MLRVEMLENNDLLQALIQRSERLAANHIGEKGLVNGFDEITAMLSTHDPSPSPILHAIDQKGQDFGTYFFAAYSETRDLGRSIQVYRTVKALVRYILLMDRHYEVGNKRYFRMAKALLKTVKEDHESGHVRYSIDFSFKQFWPFWDFEQKMKQLMLSGYTFSFKEIRYHNLFKSSDAPIIYARVLDNELPNFNQNVSTVLHYNQALQDLLDDLYDIEEDLIDLMPNFFILAALDEIPLEKLARSPHNVRKQVISNGATGAIMPLVEEYGKQVREIELPANYRFLKHLSSFYVKELRRSMNGLKR